MKYLILLLLVSCVDYITDPVPKFKVGDCILHSHQTSGDEFTKGELITIVSKINEVGKKYYITQLVVNQPFNMTIDVFYSERIEYIDREYIQVEGELCGDDRF